MQAGTLRLDTGHGVSTAATFIGKKATFDPKPGWKSPECTTGFYRDDLVSGFVPYVKFVPLRIAEHVLFNLKIERVRESTCSRASKRP